MNKISHKVLSFLMAFVVLFSTMSFTVDMHYCGNTLIDTAVFKQAETCGMKMESPSTKDCSITKKNCCSNEQISIDGQDELQLLVDKVSFDQQVFVAAFIYSYSNLFEDLEKDVTNFGEYPPPLIVRDIYKLDETYLI